jgi:hypothetical protein
MSAMKKYKIPFFALKKSRSGWCKQNKKYDLNRLGRSAEIYSSCFEVIVWF